MCHTGWPNIVSKSQLASISQSSDVVLWILSSTFFSLVRKQMNERIAERTAKKHEIFFLPTHKEAYWRRNYTSMCATKNKPVNSFSLIIYAARAANQYSTCIYLFAWSRNNKRFQENTENKYEENYIQKKRNEKSPEIKKERTNREKPELVSK